MEITKKTETWTFGKNVDYGISFILLIDTINHYISTLRISTAAIYMADAINRDE